MYSTNRNINNKKSTINPNAVCNKYLQYPDETSKRQDEGGLRLNKQYKHTLKDKPLITVITIVYNNEETLERCIKSVLEQTYDNIEYLVIDGGSNDGTLDIIEKYKDSIDYFISEPDKGIYDAMNKGISLASGDYLNFMNSTDLFHNKNVIEDTVFQINQNPDCDYAVGKMQILNLDGTLGSIIKPTIDRVFLSAPYNHQSIFYKNICFNELGEYNTKNYKYNAENDFAISLFLKNYSFLELDFLVAKYEYGNNILTFFPEIKEAEERKRREIHFLSKINLEHSDIDFMRDYLVLKRKDLPVSYFYIIKDKLSQANDKETSQLFFHTIKNLIHQGTQEYLKKIWNTLDFKKSKSTKSKTYLAPVIIFTYNRVDILKRTINALSNNYFAEETDLYIFSDGAKLAKQEDTKKVQEVRAFIKTIEGFKSVTIKEQKINIGLANSVIGGINEVSQKYKNFIVLEDDLLTSPFFLKYMNESLEKYEEEEKVWSINGIALNPKCLEIPKEYKYDTYFNYRNSPYGWASWSDRWGKAIWDHSQITYELSDYRQQLLFNRGGNDMYPMMKSQLDENSDSWAINWSYSISRNDGVNLSPRYSLVTTQTSTEETYIKGDNNDLSLALEEVTYPDTLEINHEIARRFALNFNSNIPILLNNHKRDTTLSNDAQVSIFSKSNYVFSEEALWNIINYLNKDNQQKDTQLKKLNSKTNTLENNKWYRFGKLSRKEKIWVSGKVLSKKMKIHWALKPFAQVVKKIKKGKNAF